MKHLLLICFALLLPIYCSADDWSGWEPLNDGALNGVEFSHKNECAAAMKGPNCILSWRFLSNYEEATMAEFTISWDTGNELKHETHQILLQPGENSSTSYNVSGLALDEISLRITADQPTNNETARTQTEALPAGKPLQTTDQQAQVQQEEAQREELRKAEQLRQQEQEELRRTKRARQQELEDLRRAEKARQQEQEELNQAEKVRSQKQEELRLAEMARLKELEELRLADMARQQKQEQLNRAEKARQQEQEELRLAEKARQQKQEELNRAEKARQQEQEALLQAEKLRQQKQEELKRAEKALQQEQEELAKAEQTRLLKQEELRKAKRIRQQEQEDLRRAEKARHQELAHTSPALPPAESKPASEQPLLRLAKPKQETGQPAATPAPQAEQGGESSDTPDYTFAKPATDCITTFVNTKGINTLAYKNSCSYAVLVFYTNPGLGTLKIGSERQETSGFECGDNCTPIYGACPEGYTVLNTSREPYTPEMQRERQPFLCGKVK